MRFALGALALVLTSLTTQAGVAAEDQLPNLRPRTPYDIRLEKPDDDVENPHTRALRFTITTDNLSDYALEIRGIPRIPEEINSDRKTAEQCVAWVSKICSETAPVGQLYYHSAHSHWHFDDYALYELRKVTPAGQPDFSSPAVAPGNKASFCLEDSDYPPNTDYPDLILNPPRYGGCDSYIQGISPHYGDTYDWGLPGQQIIVDDVPDGTYALVVTVNPTGRIHEITTSDNVAWTLISLHVCDPTQMGASGVSLVGAA
jgi:hypothetical protein